MVLAGELRTANQRKHIGERSTAEVRGRPVLVSMNWEGADVRGIRKRQVIAAGLQARELFGEKNRLASSRFRGNGSRIERNASKAASAGFYGESQETEMIEAWSRQIYWRPRANRTLEQPEERRRDTDYGSAIMQSFNQRESPARSC